MAGSFGLDISKFAEKAKGRLDLVVRKISLDLFSRVIMATPVDTGRARGNWAVRIGSVPRGVLELTDKEGTATISAADAAVLQLKAGDVIFLGNSVAYIKLLEDGSSKQAPAGMIASALAAYPGVVRLAVEETKQS